MAEPFLIKGVDVMAQDTKTALEMMLQERQVIEYWYNKDEDTRKGGLERFVKLVQLMILKADHDDDDEMSYAYESMCTLINFFDLSNSGREEKDRDTALGILDFVLEQGISFTQTKYCQHSRTNLRDYLIKKVYDKRPLIKKMSNIGIDLNAALTDGNTPVYVLVSRDRSGSDFETDPDEQELADLMEFFSLESMEALNNKGESAVHVAVRKKHYEALEAMIKKGVNVNITEDSPAVAGTTPLHVACKCGFPRIVQMLMDAGADDTIKNVNEETPAHIAVKRDIFKEIKPEVSAEMLRILKNTDIPGMDGKTPLMLAQDRDSWGLTSVASPILIGKGADVNRKDSDGNNAMMLDAKWSGHMDVLKAMLNAGLDINARNKDGDTLLHIYLKSNHIQEAIYLVKKGADYNIANNKQITPVQIAVEDGRDEILEFMNI